MKINQKIAVIIVNYQTPDLTIKCLRSLEPEILKYPGSYAVVVENGSKDSSKEKIKSAIKKNAWNNWAKILVETENLGFGHGNNTAIRHIFNSDKKPDYFWLLNPDTIVRSGAMDALVKHLGKSPKVGIAGSRLDRMNGTVHCSAHRFHTPISEIWERGLDLGPLSNFFKKYMVSPQVSCFPHECDWVSGASCMVKRQVFESIGVFDENYFLYYEDVDLCYRAKKDQWQVWYIPSSRVMHIENAFNFRNKFYSKPKYWYESRMRFFVKSYKIKGLIAADLFRFIGVVLLHVQNILRKEKIKPNIKLSDLIFGDIKAMCSSKVFKVS